MKTPELKKINYFYKIKLTTKNYYEKNKPE